MYSGIWKHLGYEVADTGIESANAGMGHVDYADRVPPYRSERMEFGEYINEYNLFDSFKMAEEFCFFEDERVPEHAPFFPYSIWTLNITDQGKDRVRNLTVDFDYVY